MSRQVDVKALVSHIIKGDGEERCRICMGETSEGQVFLGDTVMMDGTRAVTLAELLVMITGIEVYETREQPRGICRVCSEETIAAAHFRNLCQQSEKMWNGVVNTLLNIDEPEPQDKVFYVFYNGDSEAIVKDQIKEARDTKQAYLRLTETLQGSTKQRSSKKTRSRQLIYCSCPDCDKTFCSSYNLNDHLKKSSNRACYYCATILPRENLKKHLSTVHKKNLLECSACYKLFDTRQALNDHKTTLHDKGNNCRICGEGFATKRSLRGHSYAHTLFYCNGCSASFDNRKCLKHHNLMCKPTKQVEPPPDTNYVCHDCGMVYNNKASLRIHIVHKHLNILPYACNECGRRTSTIAHLKSHQLTHKTDRKELQCNLCGAKLRTALGYALHQRIHTGEKPYECSECGEKFLSSSRRLDHFKRRHRSATEMPHACTLCPMRFLRPFEMKKHYAHVHSKEMKTDVVLQS